MKNTDTYTLTVVPLGTTFFHGSLISHELTRVIEGLEMGEKILLLYNRRGAGRAWICEDCGYFPLCPHCDIALAYHQFPHLQLVCHHCSYRTGLLGDCPSCHGHTFHEVGIGIQRVSSDLERIFPDAPLLRIDSDSDIRKSELLSAVGDHTVILSTYTGLSLVHVPSIVQVVIVLFESDLTLPDYRMEEDLYHVIDYLKKSSKPLMIQTYVPDHPLLATVVEGNYRDFLRSISEERKKFHYPSYTDFVTIRIHDHSKEKLRDMVAKLVNKIETLKGEDIFLAYDRDIWERSHGEWIQKIILKGKPLKPLLDTLEVELVRNRSITLDWN